MTVIPSGLAAVIAGKVAEVATAALVEVAVQRIGDELATHGYKQPLSDARHYFRVGLNCLRKHAESQSTETKV